jgi:hypothetical protein
MSEWLRVMLEEIARKKAEAEQVRAEAQRRSDEGSRRDEGGRSDEGSRSDQPAPDIDRAQE